MDRKEFIKRLALLTGSSILPVTAFSDNQENKPKPYDSDNIFKQNYELVRQNHAKTSKIQIKELGSFGPAYHFGIKHEENGLITLIGMASVKKDEPRIITPTLYAIAEIDSNYTNKEISNLEKENLEKIIYEIKQGNITGVDFSKIQQIGLQGKEGYASTSGGLFIDANSDGPENELYQLTNKPTATDQSYRRIMGEEISLPKTKHLRNFSNYDYQNAEMQANYMASQINSALKTLDKELNQ